MPDIRIVIDNEDRVDARTEGNDLTWTANAYLVSRGRVLDHLSDNEPGLGATPEAALAELLRKTDLPKEYT